MPLHQVDWRLREGAPIEEVGIVGESYNAGGNLQRPRTPRLGYTKLGPERPSVVAEVEQFGVVVLAQRGRHLQRYPDNEVLLVVRKLLYRKRGSAEQVYRKTKSRIAKSRHLARSRLAVHEAMRGKGRIGQYHIELGGFARYIEGSHVGQDPRMGMKLCVGDRRRWIEGNFALGVKVAANQEI